MIKNSLAPLQIFGKQITKTGGRFIMGFTLIETLVAIAVFSLAFGAVSGFLMMAYKTQDYSWQQAVAIDDARRGTESMVKEIREAREGADGSYAIEEANDKEFIFYSDIDQDDQVERVRYFLGTVGSGTQTQECQTFAAGGTCNVNFSNFLQGTLLSSQVKVSVDGDFGAGNEYADIFADGSRLGDVCKSGCNDCPGAWQGTIIFDATLAASDNSVNFLGDASTRVDPNCPHAMKAKFELSWTEDLSAFAHEFKKGVTKPVSGPGGSITYPSDQEKITVLSSYVRNAPPIFEYFDKNGNKIEEYPARVADTSLMKLYLVVNVNPNRMSQNFGLETSVQLRNLSQ